MKQWLCALGALLVSAAALAAVDLNTASKDELVALPGIGPAKAQAIVDYRAQNGPFKAVEEVRKVRGIGEKLFQQIRPELTVATGTARAAPAAGNDAKAAAKGAPTRSSGSAIARSDAPRK